jgi:hypothetical protein
MNDFGFDMDEIHNDFDIMPRTVPRFKAKKHGTLSIACAGYLARKRTGNELYTMQQLFEQKMVEAATMEEVTKPKLNKRVRNVSK